MGRPITFDREKALETVMNEIWVRGYDACSVKFISEKLGITRSSFYNAFGSRESLFLEVLDAYFRQSPDYKLSEIDGHGNLIRLICDVFRCACKVRAADPESRGCLAVNSICGLVGTNQTLGPVLEDAFTSSINRFEQLLQLAADSHEIPDKDIHAKALALQNLLIGMNVLSMVVHSETELWNSTRHTLMCLGLYEE
ncbi:MAG TPA: TetR/AcrR family transcriptional regulator [Gammaproteobacteria bacterium]|nr:TetR/AcrR family transcriptional regulator [Gammaproteobacteria bacterium]